MAVTGQGLQVLEVAENALPEAALFAEGVVLAGRELAFSRGSMTRRRRIRPADRATSSCHRPVGDKLGGLRHGVAPVLAWAPTAPSQISPSLHETSINDQANPVIVPGAGAAVMPK